MAAVNKLLRGQYIFLTGILGAVSHNAGQILAAFSYSDCQVYLRTCRSL